jgi:uncharacterized protein
VATTSPDRILSLDVIRGIAVMGIFSVNVVGMAMIERAYFNPPDYGFHGLGDRIMWAANFILVDGKFRSLFSILFGASMVLVIERGVAAGKAGWQVHYPRMIVLLLFGLAHFYFLWWGDILANYALVGMIAFAFWRLSVRHLLLAATVSLALIYIPMVARGVDIATAPSAPLVTVVEGVYMDSADSAASREFGQQISRMKDREIAIDKAAHATPAAHVRQMLNGPTPLRPFESVPSYGLETLGLMLLGMAGYKSGFLTGAWSRRRYAQVAAVLVGASLLWFGQACWRILEADFAAATFQPWGSLFMAPMHPFSAMGYAALAILAFGSGGAFAERLAAVGRAAFTNYLGATMIGTVLFFGFGFGLYGELSRGQAWLIVPVVWAVMLLWSKSWLDRFRYGPFEWAWRCLARWKWEPMRERPREGPAVA